MMPSSALGAVEGFFELDLVAGDFFSFGISPRFGSAGILPAVLR
jgi:hypothetical protein